MVYHCLAVTHHLLSQGGLEEKQYTVGGRQQDLYQMLQGQEIIFAACNIVI